jgi:hypothetical protein
MSLIINHIAAVAVILARMILNSKAQAERVDLQKAEVKHSQALHRQWQSNGDKR